MRGLRFLLMLLALWLGWFHMARGQGAADFIIGDSTDLALVGNHPYSHGQGFVWDTSRYQYTAIAGDRITTVYHLFRSWIADTTVNIEVGLYEWDATGDSATARVYLDTMTGTNTTGITNTDSIYGLTWDLTAGKRYTIAFANATGSSSIDDTLLWIPVHAIAVGDTNHLVIRYENDDDPAAGLTDPYTWAGGENRDYGARFWARGVNIVGTHVYGDESFGAKTYGGGTE